MQYRLIRNVHVCAVSFNKEYTRVCSIVVIRNVHVYAVSFNKECTRVCSIV